MKLGKPHGMVLAGFMTAVFLMMVPGSSLAVPGPEECENEQAAPEAVEKVPVKKIKMVAENWKWTPNLIRVKKGTKLVIQVDNYDAPHAFFLKAFRVKVPLPQDKITTFEFVADKAGEFKWKCSRPCGNGCAKMTGKLVVIE